MGKHSGCKTFDTKIQEPGKVLLGLSGRGSAGEQKTSNPATAGIKSLVVIQVSLQHKTVGD